VPLQARILGPVGFGLALEVPGECTGKFAGTLWVRYSRAGEQFLKEILEALEKPWEQGHADREDLARLLKALTAPGIKREDKSFVVAKACLWSRTAE
jgi:hypothetical protein